MIHSLIYLKVARTVKYSSATERIIVLICLTVTDKRIQGSYTKGYNDVTVLSVIVTALNPYTSCSLTVPYATIQSY